MKTAEIREKLISEINSSDNKNLLEELYRYLNRENRTQKTYNLSDEQKLAIEEAREQINKGDYLTSEEANQEIDEWLKR
ncbi:hypothetical protein GUB10_05530 [Salegentibacter sp. BLCTC]|uniref:hypothetical protein n=1 Tax=Salegentibacter sp. BLCTC TaxID=2697368 RepID=UPI00187B82B0|nr:hypothetical protein [Salegentibacter sp. BLCTC]MBE7639790.1 hypothetical protein [Salegentibacter sp. BLCTC]